jgi:hypothetical protein
VNPFYFGRAIGDLHRIGSPTFFDIVINVEKNGTQGESSDSSHAFTMIDTDKALENRNILIKVDALAKAYIEKFSNGNVSIPETLANITRNLEANSGQILAGQNLTQLAENLFNLQFNLIRAIVPE